MQSNLPTAIHSDCYQQPEGQFHHRSCHSSSNELISSDPYHETHIPMQDIRSHPSKENELQHDPLPPPIDYTDVKPSIRYQFRGLARRTLTYHRRQRVSNMCCLVIWPVLLVVLCFASSVMMGGDKHSGYTGTVRFCANEVNREEDLGFQLDKVRFPEPGTDIVKTSWYPSQLYRNTGLAGEATPCVRWFSQPYPSKAPYEDASTEALAQPDSYYIPPPSLGWLRLGELQQKWREKNPFSDRSPAYFSFWPINQTVYYTAANDQVAKALGNFSSQSRYFESEYWPPSNASILYNSSAPGVIPGTGIFGAIPVRYMKAFEGRQVDNPNDPRTYYTSWSAQMFLPQQSQEAMDKTIVDLITTLGANPYGSLSSRNMPFGAVSYEELDIDQSRVRLTMQLGQPPTRNSMYSEALSSGVRQIITMTQLTSATVKIKHAGKYVLSQGIRALPQEWSTSTLEGQSLNQVSAYLFPFGLSFLLPTFVSILVQEKEDRHRIMMAMNGLKASSYYLSHYVEFIAMQLILSLVFCLTCVAISSQFILRTNPIIVIFLLVLWAHIQTTLAFLLATFFSRTRRAVLVVYFFVAFSCIMTSVSDQIFQDGKPFAWFIHPSFSFFNILSVGITSSSRINGLYPLKWRDFAVGTTLFNCVVLMIGESIIFVLLTFYIDAVAPTEYGVQKPWHFPVSFFFKRRDTPQIQSIESQLATHQEASYHGAAEGDQDILEGADADVYAERERVRSYYDPAKAPLIIQNLFHRYPGKVDPALKGLSFGLEPNTVLGLLGPNGAGKSTLIHLLTGLYQPTSGTAYVAGASIRTDMPTIHSKIGVCPQHDILWGDLTVADHLLFYARLHGIPPHLEQQAVAFAIASVSLTSFRDRQVKGLSGGEKRRVSIAISLLGDNAVILMDEPSTGLDPAVRRVIWDIVNRVKANRTIVLTTHSMEEADILSDRIAIMTSGRLRCIGTSLHLKELYGSGFRLNISSKPGKLQEACESIELKVLKSFKYTRVDKFTNASTYEIELLNQDQEYVNGHGQLSKIFSYLSRPDQFPAIEDWGLSQTTLEDVFIKIVTDGDAALAMPTIVS